MGAFAFDGLRLDPVREFDFGARTAVGALPSVSGGLIGASGLDTATFEQPTSASTTVFAGWASDIASTAPGVELLTLAPPAASAPCACCGGMFSHTGGQRLSEASVAGATYLNFDQRGGTGDNGKPSKTTEEAAVQLGRQDLWWAETDGKTVITYAFRATAPIPMPYESAGFSQFNATQISQTLLALQSWSDVADITFVRVQDQGSAYSDNATMLFGNFNVHASQWAFGYFPGWDANAGDMWLNVGTGTPYWDTSANSAPAYQNWGRTTIVHELGHNLGLAHPSDYNNGTGNPNYDVDASYFEDSLQYTIMSYWSETNTGADFGGAYPAAPMLDDIAAIQRLYGANMSARTGDTIYGFNSNTARDFYTASTSSSKLVFAAWDAGGVDTFDFSKYTQNQKIDLRQGFFSDVGGLKGNVAIAVGAVIERAVGGSGADTITGNSAANTLTGGLGGDKLYGGLGGDTLNGGDGSDMLYGGAGNDSFWGGSGVDAVSYYYAAAGVTANLSLTTWQNTGGEGWDQFSSVEQLYGGQNWGDVLTGTPGDNIVWGYGGDDEIYGRAGVDDLRGGAGDDFIEGGSGNDSVAGGDGVDWASYYNAAAGVTVSLALTGRQNTVGAGSDLLSGIERLYGSSGFGDKLTGGGGDDTLYGDGGSDNLYGGAGADLLDGGAGNDGIYGGTGDDAASYYNNAGAVTVNLSLTGRQNTGTAGSDLLSGIQILHGSLSYGDTLLGSGADDTLYGWGGADSLRGGAGVDMIDGGDGADTLSGGSGGDRFVFNSTTDSDLSEFDRITDLGVGDVIDLSAIDANGGGAGSTAFTRMTGTFTAAGQLRLVYDGAGTTRLEMNTDSDSSAEMVILLSGNHTAATAEDGWAL